MVARSLRVSAGLMLALSALLMSPRPVGASDRTERIQKAITTLTEPSNVWISHIWFVPSEAHLRASDRLAGIGEPAVGPLLELLRSEAPEQRALALRTLGKIRDPRVVPALIDAFEHDEFWGVREEAAEALAQERDSRAIDPLLRSIRSEPTRYAIRALRRFPSPEVISTLKGLLSLSHLKVTYTYDLGEWAGYSLGEMGDAGARVLQDAAHDPRAEVRLGAGYALVLSRRRSVVQTAVGLLDDPHPYVRQIIAFRLGLKRRRVAIPSLIRLLDDPETDVRRSAAMALGDIGDRRAAPALVKALCGADLAVSLNAAEALGKVRGREGVDSLIALLQVGTEPSREFLSWRAAVALGKIGDRRAVQPLLEVVRSSNRYSPTRTCAIRALGELRYRPALPDVNTALQSTDPSIRAAAAEALGRIGDRNSGALLIERLTDTDYVRENAAVSLGQLRVRAAVEPLRQMMIRDYRNYPRYSKARDAIIRITGRAPKFAPGEFD